MMGVQFERAAHSLIEVGWPEHAANFFKVTEGHVDLGPTGAFQTIERESRSA